MDEIYFPPRELAVMSVLWRLGSATVTEVRSALEEDLAYTSVLSALQTLEEKGYVRHEAEGRAYRYFSTVAADRAGKSALARIRDAIFQGLGRTNVRPDGVRQAARSQTARGDAAAPRRSPGREPMISWMVYSVFIALIVAAAGRAAEWLARLAGYRVRWIWAGTLALAVTLSASAPSRTSPRLDLPAASVVATPVASQPLLSHASWRGTLLARAEALRHSIDAPLRSAVAIASRGPHTGGEPVRDVVRVAGHPGSRHSFSLGVGRRFRRARSDVAGRCAGGRRRSRRAARSAPS